ncbi:Hydrogenase expression/formation protein hupK [Bradyrhizobium sp. STM 3843]|uniref:hydrogenase assembly protein HupF n=1 Tax=Bradyrhizobium sp. STM 3843 TaxID=551947 RepID=UPI00024049D6|nr:hydrogenase assembly protein HupF [Bradyrhizobium sp. STM 3843]CCE11060.1 Hydrogenase expression/formation protein hupK [Bradyrhizobium sp. STM 3843]
MSPGIRDQIDLALSVVDGRIAAVDIRPRTRPPLSRIFAGKPAEKAAAALPRLFSLCAAAHQVAFLSALDAAYAREVAPLTQQRRTHAVVAERLAELLRSLLVPRLAQDRGAAVGLRKLLQAVASLAADTADRSRIETLSQIKTALAALGLCLQPEEIVPESPLASIVVAANDRDWTHPMLADQGHLSAADDPLIVTRLLDEGASFADRPDLSGRVPETGVWARHILRTTSGASHGTLVERLRAKVAEIIQLVRWLENQQDDNETRDSGVVESYPLGRGRGAAAVECARGRLYHAVELDGVGQIVHCEFLAPTEWNFHPRGPVARALTGAAISMHDRDAVEALVGAFDACVGVRVELTELADA